MRDLRSGDGYGEGGRGGNSLYPLDRISLWHLRVFRDRLRPTLTPDPQSTKMIHAVLICQSRPETEPRY